MGNDGIEVSQTTDGSSVSIDTAIPELSSYALSVNGSPSYTAKPGDTLKVEFCWNNDVARPISESEPFELENGAILYAGYSQALSDGMVFHTISIEY